MLIACADLEDTGHPVVLGLLSRKHRLAVSDRLLALDTRIIRDVDEAFAKILDAVDYSLTRQLESAHSGLSYTARSGDGLAIQLTDKAVVSRHVGPFLGWIDLIVQVHGLVCFKLAAWRKGSQLQIDPLRCVIIIAAIGAPSLLFLLIFIFRVDDLDGKRTLGSVVLAFWPGPLTRRCHS